ncbi:MAG: sulfatase [Pyrinomonadaceae bacterium]
MNQTLRMFSAAALLVGLSLLAQAQTRRPNIVVIVADDLGYGDIGSYGGKDIPTPNLDALARDGVRFTDAYVSGPYCSPTRAGLLTGKYPQRFGHEYNILPNSVAAAHAEIGLPVTEVTMADRFKAAGYSTALFGKWHLGSAARFHPMERGFEEFFGFVDGAHSYMSPTVSQRNPLYEGRKPVAEPAYLTDVLADRAVEYINRKRTQPFFLYLAFNAVHVPLEATDKYLKRFAHIPDAERRVYAAMLSAMDDGIGKTLDALDDNTIVFFFNDNGGPTFAGGRNGSSNAPLRGSKRTSWEGGVRVPLIVKWKGHLAAGTTYSQPVIQLDVLPTALAAAGIKFKANDLDGVDLLPFLGGKRSARPHEMLYWRTGGIMAIRKGDWKLMRMSDNAFREPPFMLTDLSQVELYNLKDDISETKNLTSTNPKKVKELAANWTQWTKGLAKPGWVWPPARSAGR